MTDQPRLIERAFPLKQTSMDSVHEKNVRHGHISTLHIWPARRPLAACRAALIATLLPDPGTPEKRKELCEKFAGRVVEKREKKKLPNGQIVERVTEETEGGILHWKRETENKDTLEWFRQEIRKAYGGRAPKVLDPFAGGGAIPLEAMRLGCEVTASDINPVAWFLLKCTLEYPQKLAGQTRPLPDFILKNRDFMTKFFESKDLSKKDIAKELEKLGHEKTTDQHLPGMARKDVTIEADLAWHVRAWGQWVLAKARPELAPSYPTYADFQPLKDGLRSYEKQSMRLVPLKGDGTADMDKLNEDFTEDYLRDPTNPRWVAKPPVAYLWARTVKCKNCRAIIPLLKTRWLCKVDKKRIVLTMEPNSDRTGVVFGVQSDVPLQGSGARQRADHDRKIGLGVMSRAGAACPCCSAIMTMEDIRLEGRAGRLDHVTTAVIVEGLAGKEYRCATPLELEASTPDASTIHTVFAEAPFGLPEEPTPKGGNGASRAFSVHGYGLDRWSTLFTRRQLLVLGSLLNTTRAARAAMHEYEYPSLWTEALCSYLAIPIDKVAAFNCTVTRWFSHREGMCPIFSGYRIEIMWDFGEIYPLGNGTGAYIEAVEWLARVLHFLLSSQSEASADCRLGSAISSHYADVDVVLTDPPYYDAIPYSDAMDFFYVWLRRCLQGVSADYDRAFACPLSPKWEQSADDGELIDDAARHNNDRTKSKHAYEQGMARSFQSCHRALRADGRLVIVFAHKQPDAWETLVSAIIQAGFVVDASWPIQTEMGARSRAIGSAALSSSVWLVCKKRGPSRPGWRSDVLKEMQSNIEQRLVEFWDAGIRGPDFVWAALGPALAAYSKYPVVKTDKPENPTMAVSEFLSHVRRIVIDFVVGRVLSHGEKSDMQLADKLDGVTAYYLLHRNDFRMDPAPAGACILYALSCGVSDHDLSQVWGLTMTAAEKKATEESESAEEDGGEESEPSGKGSEVRLRVWTQRKTKSLGYEAPNGREVPIIDRIHRLMHLWTEGDVQKVDSYLDDNALRQNELFRRVLQAIIELAEEGAEERSLLESISNHIQGKGAVVDDKQKRMNL
jgi:putative DNA methylase